MVLGQLRSEGAADSQDSERVDLEHAAGVFVAHFGDRPHQADAGVIDDDVEAAAFELR